MTNFPAVAQKTGPCLRVFGSTPQVLCSFLFLEIIRDVLLGFEHAKTWTCLLCYSRKIRHAASGSSSNVYKQVLNIPRTFSTPTTAQALQAYGGLLKDYAMHCNSFNLRHGKHAPREPITTDRNRTNIPSSGVSRQPFRAKQDSWIYDHPGQTEDVRQPVSPSGRLEP